MRNEYFLDLAQRGLAMPIGTDLVLRQQPDHHAIVRDGRRLGQVLEQAARRFGTPLGLPLMDLSLEKSALLGMLGVPADQHDTFHFNTCPGDDVLRKVEQGLKQPLDERLAAAVDAIRYITTETNLMPVGMCIGPFSLMTKLLADPITPLYMAGMGTSPDEDEEVKMVQRLLELSTKVILRSVEAQLKAGAKMIFVAEPAANKAYISPNQIEVGSDIFEKYVMAYNRQYKALLDAEGADLFFHCCGELIDPMLISFASLKPAIMSLGSSRQLWEDAAIVDKSTVLYGNLPSKRFYSDDEITAEQVKQQSHHLLARMRQTGHPFILGTECDVLSVPGCEQKILRKIDAILEAARATTDPIQSDIAALQAV